MCNLKAVPISEEPLKKKFEREGCVQVSDWTKDQLPEGHSIYRSHDCSSFGHKQWCSDASVHVKTVAEKKKMKKGLKGTGKSSKGTALRVHRLHSNKEHDKKKRFDI